MNDDSGHATVGDGQMIDTVDSVTYYVPKIPSVPGTARYQHALAVTEVADTVRLITHETVPDKIQKIADRTTVVSGESVVSKAKTASFEFTQNPSTIFFTTFHYETALAGLIGTHRISRANWVVDVYDMPAQYRFNDPISHHSITTRLLTPLLNLADRAIVVGNPQIPGKFGRTRTYIDNGSPVSMIDATHERGTPFRMIWVGSPRLDRGGDLLLEALSLTDTSVALDIYGEEYGEVTSRLDGLSDRHSIVHHGWSSQAECYEAIKQADVGYCVLPNRTDWRYAHPIKLGEYLAGGTVPIASAFPGMMQVAGRTGWYVSADAAEIAHAIDELATLPVETYTRISENARTRAETRSWSRIREDVADALLLSARYD